MQKKTLKQMWHEIAEKILEVKIIKICIGKEKRPIDKENEIIFHIDI